MTLHVQPSRLDLVDGLADLGPERQEDVGVVDLELLDRSFALDLVGETLGRGEVLAEGVVGHEDTVLGAVREHRVGPVDHRLGQERQRLSAQVERVAAGTGSTTRPSWYSAIPFTPTGDATTFACGISAMTARRPLLWSGSMWLTTM